MAEQSSGRPASARGRAWASLALIFAGAVVLLTAFLVFLPESIRPNEKNDYTGYYRPVAENVIDGDGLTTIEGGPSLRYPPGYPLILAGLFLAGETVGMSHDSSADVFKVLVLAACCVLVFAMARMIFSQAVAWLAALLWVTYPINVMMGARPYSEIPFTLVLYLLIMLLLSGLRRGNITVGRAFALGALVGACALIRPAAIAMAVPIIAVLWISGAGDARRRAALGAAVLVANLLVLAPWELWAWDRTGDIIPLSNGGTESIVAGLTVGFQQDQSGKAALPGDVADVMKEVAEREESFRDNGDVARYLWDKFQDRPLTVVKLFLVKAARSWYATDSLRHEIYIALVQLPYIVLSLVGFSHCFRAGRLRRSFAILVAGVIVYLWLVTISVTSIIRIMSPVAGLLMPFTAIGLLTLAAHLPGRAATFRAAMLGAAGRQS